MGATRVGGAGRSPLSSTPRKSLPHFPPPSTMIVTSSGDGPAASARTSLVTLINSAVGVGVLSLPYAFRCAGWAGGLFLIATIAATEAFTLYVLSRYAEFTRASSYSSMVHRMLGPHASYALGGILLSYLFGSCVAYLIILADCLHPIAAGILGEAWFTSRAAVLIFAAVFIVLPLCLPDTLDAISGIGVFALYGIGIMVGLITYRNVEIASRSPDPWEDLVAWNWSMDFFSALPIVIFGMQCHCQVITVFRELEAEPRILRPHRALRYRQAAELEGAASDGPVRESVGSSLAASPMPSASNLAGLEAAEAERREDAA
ncbi:transmembrane amino acid transporter protein, partial [Helicosporidium sp. ATCC 50920]